MIKRVLVSFVLLGIGVATGMAAALAVDRYDEKQTLEAAFDRLRLFHNLRKSALEDYLGSMASDVRAASENPHVVEAMKNIDFAWRGYGPEAKDVLRRLYVDDSPVPPNQRYRLRDAGDGSYYSQYHSAFHAWAQRFLKHFGYYDVFLINPRGEVVYTVAKESDFGTNLKTGPYRKSPLAEVFRRAIQNPSASVDFSDFARYEPSGSEPAAFAGHAIFKGKQVIGVFAVQIPPEPLNELMHFTGGMGTTGETYLVGPDGLMRSQSRFIEDKTLLETRVESASVRKGTKGKKGAHVTEDYRGVPVLSVYAPINFGGQPWVLLAEIDRTEVLAKRHPWMPLVAGLFASLLAMGVAWLLWRLVVRRLETSVWNDAG
jgi:methyl-accepting chemotaxis protein